jgi:hypothetical protein
MNKCVATVALITCLSPMFATAQETLDYQGSDLYPTSLFETRDVFVPGLGYGPVYPYTGDTFIFGSITLAQPLAPNLTDAVVTPLSISFNSGNIGYVDTSPPYSIFSVLGSQFEFTTNSQGQIVGWNFDLRATVLGTNSPTSFSITSNTEGDTSDTSASGLTTSSDTTGQSIFPGRWTITSVSVPEICTQGTVPALSLFLGSLAALRGRRRTEVE